ncbi:MAG: DUF2127 domain-containing protein [Terracidiphilus sp.]|jgi:uncharacterized membrane protein (DUF2068 family)
MAQFRFPARTEGPQSRNRVLLLIAVYKFFHALFFYAIGIGAHHLLHKDIADQIELFARHLRFNPESRLVIFILQKSSIINGPVLERISLVAYCYATLTLVEGIGLYLEKAWGEFLTLAITASFLPWEILEIFRHLTWVRVGLLTINILVFVYLLQLVLGRARRRANAWKSGSPPESG